MTLKPRWPVGPGKPFCQSAVLSSADEVGWVRFLDSAYNFTPNKFGERLGLKPANGKTRHEVFRKAQGVT